MALHAIGRGTSDPHYAGAKNDVSQSNSRARSEIAKERIPRHEAEIDRLDAAWIPESGATAVVFCRDGLQDWIRGILRAGTLFGSCNVTVVVTKTIKFDRLHSDASKIDPNFHF